MDTTTPVFQLYAKRKTAREKMSFIYLRITYQTDVIDRSTGIFCEYQLWRPDTSTIKSNQLLTQQLKEQVEIIKHKILGAFYILRATAPEISLREIVSVALEGEKSKAYSVFTCFESVIEKMKASSGKSGASHANIQKHGVVLKHLRQFVSAEYHWNDMPFARINRTFVDGFAAHLRNVCNCSHNTAMKQMGIFKKIYKIAVDNNWVKTNAFSGVRLGLKPVIRSILTEDEIHEIATKPISIKRIDFIRDMFIFSCFSGLAYIDLKNLRKRNIQDNLGISWIKIERAKTGVNSTIPLLEPARRILDKWTPDWRKLPADYVLFDLLSNQKTNSYLKEIAIICGIEKPISFHTSRHSFATSIALSNDVPLETVQRMLGHSKITMTQHYSKVVDIKIARDSSVVNT